MGVVYAGRGSDGSYVAVKVVRPEYAADRDFRKRFSREVALLERVRGTSVPPVLAADPDAEQPWLAIPYIPGLTLDQHVADNGPLRGIELLELATGLAEALTALHRVGIAHRDLKPANVILSPAGPRLLDLGIARAADDSTMTRTGMIVGSAGWISPEQYLGEKAGPPGDVFAWGGLVAFAATGRAPFGTGRHEILAFRVIEDEADLEGVPEDLHDLVTRALAKDPARRPSARELYGAVRQRWSALADGTPAGPAAGTVPPTRPLEHGWTSGTGSSSAWGAPVTSRVYTTAGAVRRGRRRRTVAGTAVAAGLLGLLAVGGAVLYAGQDGSGAADSRQGSGVSSQTRDTGGGRSQGDGGISVFGPNGTVNITVPKPSDKSG